MKKLKPYIITSVIVLSVLSVLFIVKGIFPFGNNSLIWGDMHDQITAFYYHFYDCIKSNSSLLVNFSTSGGINFIGILAYYILSPFSLLVLFAEREKIYLVVSVIIALKILLSSLTCLYFIKYYFKKIPNLLSVLLAIIYAFSGYSLIMYQITPWIDVMYMFPLIMIGLKKVLDLEKSTVYIITLTLALIFSFYVSFMMLIFILLAAFIYLLVYKEDKYDTKKAILSLGISTVISILLSLFIVIPSYMQISISSRLSLNMDVILNSKTGPITDKISMLLFGGIVYYGVGLLLYNYKKYKKFISFYIPTILIMLIPIIIEPINKILHFGSYAFFPNRTGFITMFLMILGACYYFNNHDLKKKDPKISKKDKIISIIFTILCSVSIFIIIYSSYNNFQLAIETLTISVNHSLLLILITATVVSIISCFIVIYLNKKLSTLSIILIGIISITHITCNSFIYLGMDKEQDILTSQYEELSAIEKDYKKKDYYRVKNLANNMIMNSGMVMRYHNLDHFTSLTNKNNLESLKKLGYSSMWVKTFSKGGTLFSDAILANKYIISRKKIDSEYYELTTKYNDLYFYTSKLTPSYGYLINNNDTIFDKDNSFDIQNSLYQNILNTDEKIFETISDFELFNLTKTEKEGLTEYKNIDDYGHNFLWKKVEVKGKKTLYLEVLKSLLNSENISIYSMFDIYINGRLYESRAFSEDNNGVLNLGTYEDEEVLIQIHLLDDLELSNLTLGIMDNQKYENFISSSKIDTDIKFNRNKITVKYTSTDEKTLFLPIAYNKGYQAKNNGKDINIEKVYDNYIGIKLNKGDNNITINYYPPGLKIGIIISGLTLIISIILFKTSLYEKLISIERLSNIAYYIYMILFFSIIIFVYVGLTLCFIISYFKIL